MASALMRLIQFPLMVGGAPGWSGQSAHGPVGVGCSATHASATTQRKALEWCTWLISLLAASLVHSFSLAGMQYIFSL